MKRCIFRILALLLLVIAISSCTQNQKLLLDENPCSPPCWFKIIPLKTEAGNIVNLLKSIQGVQFESKQDDKIEGFDAYYWSSREYIDSSGIVYSHKGVVSAIVIEYPGKSTPLKTIVNKFGFPESILVFEQSAEYRYAFAYLIYPDKGMAIITRPSNIEKEQIDLTPDTIIQSITFYNQNSFLELMTGGPLGGFYPSDVEQSYQSWNGYKLYPVKTAK